VPGLNARQNYYQHYAAVQTPCYVNGQVYNASGDTPPSLNATKLSLYDFSDPRQSTHRNTSLPESCIYRHHAQFAMAISDVLHQDVFDGTCDSYKGPICSKSGPSQLGTSTLLSNLGVSAVLKKLIDGELAYSNVTLWFDSFADAMTNRFRFQYGAGKFNATDRNLPLGEVQGLAWRMETCISAHRGWLALPICLTAITTLLMLWTIVNNWRERRTRPVWKDSILPLLYYRRKIASKNSEKVPWQQDGLDSNDDDSVPAEKALLMEANEMRKASQRTGQAVRDLMNRLRILVARQSHYMKQVGHRHNGGRGMRMRSRCLRLTTFNTTDLVVLILAAYSEKLLRTFGWRT
jgi:hypothetical protein